jgi:uncharacterized protein (DUF427 family)
MDLMSLVAGRGPLGADPAGRAAPPIAVGGAVYVEPLDTERALMVHRPGQALSYVFPADEVAGLPTEPEPQAPGFVHVPWSAVDAWFEEGRRLVHYPPNPYHRVDCRPTKRRLRVDVAGTTLVDTDDTIILFETSLAPKLYVAPGHVRTDLLRRSDTTSYCNYKGDATWWTAVVGDTVVEDVAWTYDDPFPESTQIRGWFSFEPTHADATAELPAGASLPS